jgi:hypothetical protein
VRAENLRRGSFRPGRVERWLTADGSGRRVSLDPDPSSGTSHYLPAHEKILARGGSVLTPPMTPPQGGRRCFLYDPDGYVVELEEPPE